MEEHYRMITSAKDIASNSVNFENWMGGWSSQPLIHQILRATQRRVGGRGENSTFAGPPGFAGLDI